jgi:hypothetical protein
VAAFRLISASRLKNASSTDAAADVLARLPALGVVNLDKTGFSTVGESKLKRARPGIYVYLGPQQP